MADRPILRRIAADRDRRDFARGALVGAAGRDVQPGVVDGDIGQPERAAVEVDGRDDVAGRRRDEGDAGRGGDRDARCVLDDEPGKAAVVDRRLDVRLLVDATDAGDDDAASLSSSAFAYASASPPRRSCERDRSGRRLLDGTGDVATTLPLPPGANPAIPSSSIELTCSADVVSSVIRRLSSVATNSDRPSSVAYIEAIRPST